MSTKSPLSKWDAARLNEIERYVTYNSSHFFPVLFQSYGTVWPKVLPYCLANLFLTWLIVCLRNSFKLDLVLPDQGPHLMTWILSLLMVSRANAQYNAFMNQRAELEDLYRCSKELIHHVAVLSKNDKTEEAQKWRSETAYQTILLLRITMAALDYQSFQINVWEVEELNGTEERRNMRKSLYIPQPTPQSTPKTPLEQKKSVNTASNVMVWAHGPRSSRDENLRAPTIAAFTLRKQLASKNNGKRRLGSIAEEIQLLSFVEQYTKAYENLRAIMTTPYVFPLLQMTRTFLFIWTFTLPFALIDDYDNMACAYLMIFIITYGFIGLECVCMELQDPFGTDACDFLNLEWAQMVFEDIYTTIFWVDGFEAAEVLRDRIAQRAKKGSPLENFLCDNDFYPEN